MGATKDPMFRLRPDTLSASRLIPSSDISRSKCGSNTPISTPSNLTPSTSAAAVISNIVSNGITGSESGPFPTMPGQVALWSLGKLFSDIVFQLFCELLICFTKDKKNPLIHLYNQIWVIGTKVLQHDDWIGFGGIDNGNTFLSSFFTNEKLIIGKLAVADHGRGFNIPNTHLAMTLHHNQTISCGIFNGYRLPWQNGQFFCTESGGTVTDPLFDIAFRDHFLIILYRNGLHKAGFQKIRIGI